MNVGRKGTRHRFVALLGATLAAASVVGVAAADDVSNNLDAGIDAVAEVMPLTAGGADGTTTLYVTPRNGDGDSGCNFEGNVEALTLAVSSSNTAIATVSPATVTFGNCGDTRALTVSGLSQGTTTISVAQTSNTTGGSFNLAPATFTVDVGPAAVTNAPPSIDISGVTEGASYDTGSVPVAICDVSDSEDGDSSFAATLSDITGPYSSDGIGSQTASCSYTDDGGRDASSSLTYGIVDPSAPTIGHTLTPVDPDGENGWYVGDVSLRWAVADLQSPLSIATNGCVDQDVVADQTATAYDCSVTSAGGSAGPESVTIRRDATKPEIVRDTAADSCDAPGANGWCRGEQTAGFRASDATAGLASGQAASFTRTTSDNGNPVGIPSGTVKDRAGNTSDAIDAGPFKIDSVKPTITGAGTPAANTDGWNNTDVGVAFTCADTGGSGIDACGPDDTLTNEGRDQSVTGTATDVAGNGDSATVGGIDIDRTGPSAPAATTTPASTVAGSGGWFRDSVTVAYGASADPDLADGSAGSGVAGHSADEAFDESGAHEYSGTATDKAGNASSARTGSVKVDATDPTVAITAGCPTGPVTLGSGQAIAVSAADAHSGLVSDPSGTVALDTATIGSKTKTITVDDRVGHSATTTCSYGVIYNWTGFFQPIDNGGVFNQVGAGRTIPVKFSLGGDQGMNILAAGSPASGPVSCPSGATVDTVEETSTATVSGLKYDPIASQYIYNWKTLSTYASSCRRLTVTLADGTTHTALFKFVK